MENILIRITFFSAASGTGELFVHRNFSSLEFLTGLLLQHYWKAEQVLGYTLSSPHLSEVHCGVLRLHGRFTPAPCFHSGDQ